MPITRRYTNRFTSAARCAILRFAAGLLRVCCGLRFREHIVRDILQKKLCTFGQSLRKLGKLAFTSMVKRGFTLSGAYFVD